MGKTADLTVVQKTTIDTLHKEGKTQKVIAKEAGCSQSSVSKHINREEKGRKICGRKKCTSNRDNRTLESIVKQNPFKNVGEIHKEWTAAGVSASRTTTHRRMQDMGFSCRIPCVKPLLNNRQRQKRLTWAKDKKDWTAAEWSKVMFSDNFLRIESHFQLNDSRRMWQGLRTICAFGNKSSAEVRTDPSLAEELNTFYGRFESNGGIAALPSSTSGSSRQRSEIM